MGTSLSFINLLWNGDSKVVFILALSESVKVHLVTLTMRCLSPPATIVPASFSSSSSTLPFIAAIEKEQVGWVMSGYPRFQKC
ncbi:hypothetical protein NC651_024170 [Populus alba x Populus x berolinensis]|nr:hypothetical protein NC651_024170 [Populus alba x Populus x berolinensis]